MFDTNLKEMAKRLVDFNDMTSKPIPQHVYILEEMSELSKEITKDLRGKGSKESIKNELADLLCTILTYSYSKKINADDLEDLIVDKISRAIDRIEKTGEK